jgi:soluble lytic murein transglycosylase
LLFLTVSQSDSGRIHIVSEKPVYFRLFFAFLLSISLVHSSFSAPPPFFPLQDPALQETAQALSQKKYASAREKALKAPDGPVRNFLLGVTAYHLEKWAETEKHFSGSAENLELLADYALYYRADALCHLARHDEALQLLDKLKKEYPGSRLSRAVNSLHADTLFNKKDYQGALKSSQSFIKTYPSGTDSLKASLLATLSREALGDKQGAINELRDIWLNHPDSAVATQAETHLQRLRSEGITVPPFTFDELFQRGVTLLDRGKYPPALETFDTLSRQTLTDDRKNRLAFNKAQTLFKSRRYDEAEQVFAKLVTSKNQEISTESVYWLARILDKKGQEQEALPSYLKFADSFPLSELADDALFLAALCKKNQGDHSGTVIILDRLIVQYPSSNYKHRAMWEKAWLFYRTKDLQNAAEGLQQLLAIPAYREKSLYWLGKTRQASGERELANSSFSSLAKEFPFGFYTLHFKKETGLKNDQIPALDSDFISSIPVPFGYEKVKALISLGMYQEARSELVAIRNKGVDKSLMIGIARLYWEIGDYRSVLACFPYAQGGNPAALGFSYPMAYRETIAGYSTEYGIPEYLAYSIIRAESNFSPTVLSPVGAVGLMQLMPATAKSLVKGKSRGLNTFQLTSPDLNIRLGLKHLKNLLVRYNGNLVPAIAAYNSGATPVDRWLKLPTAALSDEFIENIPYPETREYVKKVLANIEIYNSMYNQEIAPADTAPESLSSLPFSSPPLQTSFHQHTDGKIQF